MPLKKESSRNLDKYARQMQKNFYWENLKNLWILIENWERVMVRNTCPRKSLDLSKSLLYWDVILKRIASHLSPNMKVMNLLKLGTLRADELEKPNTQVHLNLKRSNLRFNLKNSKNLNLNKEANPKRKFKNLLKSRVILIILSKKNRVKKRNRSVKLKKRKNKSIRPLIVKKMKRAVRNRKVIMNHSVHSIGLIDHLLKKAKWAHLKNRIQDKNWEKLSWISKNPMVKVWRCRLLKGETDRR